MNKSRDYRFDTVKGAMILLVIFGHAIGNKLFLKVDNPTIVPYVYAVVRSFEMPVIVFISGYFSKNIDNLKPDYFKKCFVNYLLPYIIFNTIFIFSYDKGIESILLPQYTMWYLISLFFWKLMILPFSKVKGILPISIIIAILLGYTNTYRGVLSLTRTFTFFPFFLAGFFCKEELINKIEKKKVVFLVIFVALIAFVCLLHSKYLRMPVDLYMLSQVYDKELNPYYLNIIFRLVVMGIGFIAIFCCFSLVYREKNILTILGQRSMLVYLLHGRVIKYLVEYLGHLKFAGEFTFIIICMITTVLLCVLFANKYSVKAYDKLMNSIALIIMR